jgi:hypothetical protein
MGILLCALAPVSSRQVVAALSVHHVAARHSDRPSMQANETPTPTPVANTPSPAPTATATPMPIPASRALIRQAQLAIGHANTYHFVAELRISDPRAGYRFHYHAVGNAQENPYKLRAQIEETVSGPKGTTHLPYSVVRIKRRGWLRVPGGKWKAERVGHTLTVLPNDPFGSFPSLRTGGGGFTLVRLWPAVAGRLRGFMVWHVHGTARIGVAGRRLPEVFDDFIRQADYLPLQLDVVVRDPAQGSSTTITQANSRFGEKVSIQPPQ